MAAIRRGFAPARRTGSTVPRIVSGVYKTGAQVTAIIKGSILQVDGDGLLIVSAADPTSLVKGVALEAAASKLNYGEPFASQTAFATGRVQEVSYAVADAEQEFSARLETGGNIVAPLQTHIGEEYGVAVDANGQWYVDTGEGSAKVVKITDIVEAAGGAALGYVLVKFLQAVVS